MLLRPHLKPRRDRGLFQQHITKLPVLWGTPCSKGCSLSEKNILFQSCHLIEKETWLWECTQGGMKKEVASIKSNFYHCCPPLLHYCIFIFLYYFWLFYWEIFKSSENVKLSDIEKMGTEKNQILTKHSANGWEIKGSYSELFIQWIESTAS